MYAVAFTADGENGLNELKGIISLIKELLRFYHCIINNDIIYPYIFKPVTTGP